MLAFHASSVSTQDPYDFCTAFCYIFSRLIDNPVFSGPFLLNFVHILHVIAKDLSAVRLTCV